MVDALLYASIVCNWLSVLSWSCCVINVEYSTKCYPDFCTLEVGRCVLHTLTIVDGPCSMTVQVLLIQVQSYCCVVLQTCQAT